MLFSKRDITKIIVPLLIEQTLAITVGMLDGVMVSRAGEAAFSGVALVDSFNTLIIYVFTALASGGAVVISQALGAKNNDMVQRSSKQLVWFVGFISLFLASIVIIARKPILNFLFGAIDKDVMDNALTYLFYTAISYPFLGIRNAGAAILRAHGDSKTSMYASLIINMINFAGNAILIFVFNMGAKGAAIATLFSRIVGMFIILGVLCNKKRPEHVDNLLKYRPEFHILKRICGIGIPNGIENGMFQLGKVLTQAIVSGMGTFVIAANSAANTLTALQYIPTTAFGAAIITVVGRCIGAGEKEQAKYYTKRLIGLTYVTIWAISIPLCVFSKSITGLFNLEAEAHKLAIQLLIYHSIIVSILHPVAFTLTNTFRAGSDIKYTMTISIFSMWIFRLGLSYLFCYAFNFGIFGVWFAMACDWIFRAVIYIIHYKNNKWLTKFKK